MQISFFSCSENHGRFFGGKPRRIILVDFEFFQYLVSSSVSCLPFSLGLLFQAGAMAKKLRRASHASEVKAVRAVEEVAAGKAMERLIARLEEGGESLVNRVLNFLDCSAAEPDYQDLSLPYRRNLSRFSDLTLRELRVLFQAWHGQLWAEQIVRKVRLQSGRALVAWALAVELKDFLPGSCMLELRDLCTARYTESKS